jgi:Cu2+-exporting ATPase
MNAVASAPFPTRGDAPSLAGYVVREADGFWSIDLFVDGIHCGGCVRKVEGRLAADPQISSARLTLSTRKLHVRWRGARVHADSIAATIAELGYEALPYAAEDVAAADAAQARSLQLAFGVAFFALANVMMLSWALWVGDEMGPGTRGLFQWLSALVALPAIAYAGCPFYASAWRALRHARTNMDVPIAAGVLLTTAMSLSETIRGGSHIYFDGALSLLTVLLLGRWLDQRARSRARAGVNRLAELAARPVALLKPDGSTEAMPAARVRAGHRILVAAGERIGADGWIETGDSRVEASLITGEWQPQAAGPGFRVLAGMTNLDAPIIIVADRAGNDSSVAEMVRLMESAEQKRGAHVAFADRMVGYYTPVVHGLALVTFLGWWLAGGLGWQPALVHAVSVLIIACPCALGLAVPVTQVVAAGRLMRSGILLRSESALERAASVDCVVFDKTGTLTLPAAAPVPQPDDPAVRRLAAGLAAASLHPLARAIRALDPDAPALQGVLEEPGCGLRWSGPEGEVLLGSADWCGAEAATGKEAEVWLRAPALPLTRFSLAQQLRPDARTSIEALRARGIDVALLSGDRAEAVAEIAGAAGIAAWTAAMSPAGKAHDIAARMSSGRAVLMVGDGINDAPALQAATVSLAPGHASDISRNAADALWLGSSLAAVPEFLSVAVEARRIIRQNIGFSFVYNAIWVPVAMAGLVTPWLAALAMAASSLAVTLNALRLNQGWRHRP